MSWKGPYAPTAAGQRAAIAASLRAQARVRKMTKRPTGTAYTLALQTQLARRARSAGSELKFFDTSLAFNIDATGEVPATGQLVLIPQGVTESTRVGRKCVIKSLQCRGVQTFVPAAAAQASTNTYLYVVLDKQANGAAAAVTDVFTGSGLQVAFRNLANVGRFVILKKLVMNFTPPSGVTTAYNNVSKPFDFYLKCNYPIEFSSTTGAIGEIRSNNIFLLAGSDGNTDDLVTVNGACRVRYSD